MALAALTAAIDELTKLDPATLADHDTMIDLHRQLDRLEATATRAAAALDAKREWEEWKFRSAASWIAWRCRRSHSAARAEIALGRALRHLPEAEKAWLDGAISAEHVRVLARARRPATAERLAADEKMLVGKAMCTDLSFRQFCRLVAYWAQLADPDGADRDAADQADQRRFHLSQSFQGMWYADGVFDPITGAIVNRELSRIEKEFFDAEWADAKARLGREPTIADLSRTPGQRRADALVEMAIRSASAPADARRPEPLFTILVGWETFKGRICQLANGTVVAPGALVPWLHQAWIERVVFGAPSRVIDVGATRRLFSGATRRAIQIRDQECFHPACDESFEDCQADHIVPYAADGPTSQDNGRMACGFHNRSRNKPPPGHDPPG
ncbi:MAG TPA: DUF222 domain-containing protein [Acidimicrobiales bacterium]|jgi:hypothetical protein|nr:DUF222 domain-containing protein [Acidimicrobiales bacterium]